MPTDKRNVENPHFSKNACDDKAGAHEEQCQHTAPHRNHKFCLENEWGDGRQPDGKWKPTPL